MGKSNRLLHLVHGKIPGKISQTEILPGQIDGVRTKMNGDLEFFKISGRGQESQVLSVLDVSFIHFKWHPANIQAKVEAQLSGFIAFVKIAFRLLRKGDTLILFQKDISNKALSCAHRIDDEIQPIGSNISV